MTAGQDKSEDPLAQVDLIARAAALWLRSPGGGLEEVPLPEGNSQWVAYAAGLIDGLFTGMQLSNENVPQAAYALALMQTGPDQALAIARAISEEVCACASADVEGYRRGRLAAAGLTDGLVAGSGIRRLV